MSTKPGSHESLKVRITWLLENTLRDRFTLAELTRALDETYPRNYEFAQGTGAVSATSDRMLTDNLIPSGWRFVPVRDHLGPRRFDRIAPLGVVPLVTIRPREYYYTDPNTPDPALSYIPDGALIGELYKRLRTRDTHNENNLEMAHDFAISWLGSLGYESPNDLDDENRTMVEFAQPLAEMLFYSVWSTGLEDQN